jgi:Holliday junction resolvase RusA-like endonuclease
MMQTTIRKTVIFDITPQTAVRSVQGDKIYFRIPIDQLRPDGLKRRKRLERYNEYKITLAGLARAKRFSPPEQGGHLIFHIPVPKSWKEYKKREMHGQLHTQTPDWDNLAKGFFDGLLSQDKGVADVRVTKRWINAPRGKIEFIFDAPSIPSKDVLL